MYTGSLLWGIRYTEPKTQKIKAWSYLKGALSKTRKYSNNYSINWGQGVSKNETKQCVHATFGQQKAEYSHDTLAKLLFFKKYQKYPKKANWEKC